MLPEMDIRKIISGYTVSSLSVGVQDFYHGPCATVEIDHLNNISELETLLRELISKPTWLLPFDPNCDKLRRNYEVGPQILIHPSDKIFVPTFAKLELQSYKVRPITIYKC